MYTIKEKIHLKKNLYRDLLKFSHNIIKTNKKNTKHQVKI